MIDYIKIFLIIFLISVCMSSDFISCDIKKHYKNVYVKHLITFGLIFLLVVFATKKSFKSYDEDEPILPDLIINALIIHILFILSLKMDFKFTIAIVLLAVVYYLLDVEKSNKTDIINMEGLQKLIKIAILVIGIVGFYYYFMEKYSKDKQNFSLNTFLIGFESCSSENLAVENNNIMYQSF